MSDATSRVRQSVLGAVLQHHRLEEKEVPNLRVMWTELCILVGLFGIVACMVWLAILLSKKARRSPYNVSGHNTGFGLARGERKRGSQLKLLARSLSLYLQQWYVLYLMAPSWLYAIICAVLFAFNALAGGMHSNITCRSDMFFWFWSNACNAWINAVIVRELHYMLNSSHRCIRYQPPTVQRATRQCLAVYAAATLLACWAATSFPWFRPHSKNGHDANDDRNRMVDALLCPPIQFSPGGIAFLWLLYFPLLILLPCAFVVYVIYDVWKTQRLPQKGQRRTLSLYFLRIVIVCIVMSTPAMFVYGTVPSPNPWLAWWVIAIGQGKVFVCAMLTVWKPDVWTALQDLYCGKQRRSREEAPCAACQCSNGNELLSPVGGDGCWSGGEHSCGLGDSSQRSKVSSGMGRLFTEGLLPHLTHLTTASSTVSDPCAGENSESHSGEEYMGESSRSIHSHARTEEAVSSPLHSGECVHKHSGAHISGSIVLVDLEEEEESEYEDVPKQSDLHYQFDDELDENDPECAIAHAILEEDDESDLPVAPF
jgi:hypothetical protein